MTVQRYSKLEMQAIISNILKEEVTILPIGNHEIRRHLVYKVQTNKGAFVFKYYYQETYGGREISTLKLIKSSPVKKASLVDFGTFGENREWLMMTMLDGMPMDKIMKSMSKENLISIYTEMGVNLALLHESHTFNRFGDLKADGTFLNHYSNYKEAFMANNHYTHDKIIKCIDPSKPIYLEGLKRLEKNLNLLDHVKTSRLTHMDYSPRNIFLTKEQGKPHLKAVLDFELSRPWDKNADFSQMKLRNFSGHPDYETAFYKGYNSHSNLDEGFQETSDFYMLNLCLQICSWAKDIAPDYYNMAFKTLQVILKDSKYLKK